MEGQGERGTVIGDEKGTKEYWLRGNPTASTLGSHYTSNDISYSKNPSAMQKNMAKLLAEKVWNEWHSNMLALLERDVSDDDSLAKTLLTIAF